MNSNLYAFTNAFKSELTQLSRSPMLCALTMVQAVTFIFLVNFFGLTGAFAPTAIIDNDRGYYAHAFIEKLKLAHHSFSLKPMDEKTAMEQVRLGKIVAIITIPEGFSEAIDNGETIPLKVVVDNIDTDMTADIQRALPAAITAFGNEFKFDGIHAQTEEVDLIDHDTGFVAYLVVSALALSAFIISGILGGVTVAREFESKTVKLLAASPRGPFVPMLGRITATNAISALAMSAAVGIVVGGYGIYPVHLVELIVILVMCIVIFGWIGAAIGAILKRTLPVTSLIFGISLPLYLFSGTYEPERFDGNLIWITAHFTPLYYAVGIIEHAVLDLRVTPEPIYLNFIAMGAWGAISLWVIQKFVRRESIPN